MAKRALETASGASGSANKQSSSAANKKRRTADKPQQQSQATTTATTASTSTSSNTVAPPRSKIVTAPDAIVSKGQVQEFEQRILASRSQAPQGIVQLLALLQKQSHSARSSLVVVPGRKPVSSDVIVAALQSLHRIFEYYSEMGELKIVAPRNKHHQTAAPATTKSNTTTIDKAQLAFREFLRTQYLEFESVSLQLISAPHTEQHAHASVRLSCLHSQFAFCQLQLQEMRKEKMELQHTQLNQQSNPSFDVDSAIEQTVFPRLILHSVIQPAPTPVDATSSCAFDDSTPVYRHALVSQYIMSHDDVRMHTLRQLTRLIGVSSSADKQQYNASNASASSSANKKQSSQFTLEQLRSVSGQTQLSDERLTQCLFDLLMTINCTSSLGSNLFGTSTHSALESDSESSDSAAEDSDDSAAATQSKTKKAKQTRTAMQLHRCRTMLSQCWLHLLSPRHAMSQHLYKTVLLAMHTNIFPNVSSPLLLSDFLTDSFNANSHRQDAQQQQQCSITALLSLQSIFVLISRHNLTYPQFYPKLYSLLRSHLFYVKHRAKFFSLLSLFLTSSYLPAAYVAAFAKRLSRLALHAPPHGAALCITQVFNLLRRHPACRVLMNRPLQQVQRTNGATVKGAASVAQREQVGKSLTDFLIARQAELAAESAAAAKLGIKPKQQQWQDSSDDEQQPTKAHLKPSLSSASASTAATNVFGHETLPELQKLSSDCCGLDPFDAQTDDMASSHATESSLWEMAALQHHYNSSVSLLARDFTAANAPKKDMELQRVLDQSYASLFAKDLSRRANQKVQLAYEKSEKLFEQTPLLQQLVKLD